MTNLYRFAILYYMSDQKDQNYYMWYALDHGYKECGLYGSFERIDDKRYSLLILTHFISLLERGDDDSCTGLATSHDGKEVVTVYRYVDIPRDVIMKIATGPIKDIYRKLYEYDLNRSLEVLG